MSVDLGSILPGIFAVTTIVATALAGVQRAVVTSLREANKDLRDRDADRDKQVTSLETDNAKLASDLAALGRVVTNEVQIIALRDELHDQHAENKIQWQASTDIGQKILDAINRLSGGSP